MSDSTSTPSSEGGPDPQWTPPPTTEQPAAPGQPGGYPGAGQPGSYPAAPGPGYGPNYGQPVGGVGQPADLLMRFLARLIDSILVGIVNAIIASVLLVTIFGLGSGGGMGFTMGGSYVYGALSGVIGAVIALGYFVLMESRNGQTVGKMLLKLRTEGPDGAPPSTEVAIKRNFWVALGALGVIPVVGGIVGSLAELAIVILIAVTISSSPTNQGWHDKLAGSRVMKIG